MNETSRNQGWAICAGAAIAAFLFLVGLLNGSYLALAIPVAIISFFALGLVAWVGFTIATIQVDADHSPEILSPEPKTSSDASSQSPSQSPSQPSSQSPSQPASPTSDSASAGSSDRADGAADSDSKEDAA